jgi:2-oxoisovalerate dehydrogenase E1 component beta subunit
MSEDMVPEEDYEIPLRKAEVLQEGKDVTLLGYGASIRLIKMVLTRYQH